MSGRDVDPDIDPGGVLLRHPVDMAPDRLLSANYIIIPRLPAQTSGAGGFNAETQRGRGAGNVPILNVANAQCNGVSPQKISLVDRPISKKKLRLKSTQHLTNRKPPSYLSGTLPI